MATGRMCSKERSIRADAVSSGAHIAALIEPVVLPQELKPVVVLEDVVALLGEQGPKNNFNFQAATVTCLDCTFTIDV